MRPIFITGCPRSGTSVTAGIFHACGAFGGTMQTRGRHGRYSNYESVHFHNFLNGNRSCRPFRARGFRKHAEESLRKDGWDGKTRWFFKHHQLLFCWEDVREAYPEATWILVRRNPLAIAYSCIETAYMVKKWDISTKLGWLLWVEEHEKHRREIAKNCYAIEVWPSEFICLGNFGPVREAVERCGLGWNEAIVKQTVEPNRWRPK